MKLDCVSHRNVYCKITQMWDTKLFVYMLHAELEYSVLVYIQIGLCIGLKQTDYERQIKLIRQKLVSCYIMGG